MAQSSNPSFFSEEELNKVKTDCKTDGLEAVALLVQKNLYKLDNTEFNIAVTGESGAGKSTFINSMRGLQSDDEAAAKTGTTLTTMEPIGYKYPNLPYVYLWELPGIGTKHFPADKYLKKMEFKRYDFFFIISQSRFTENDAKLAKEIKRLRKSFYFIRSKIDGDLHTFEMEDRKVNTAEVLDKIRNYYVDSFKEEGIVSPTVFLISNFKVNELDFPALNKSLPDIPKNSEKAVYIFSLPNTTLEIVEKKRNLLKGKIHVLATYSGLRRSAEPYILRGILRGCDVTSLMGVIVDFCKSMGLDDASLQRLAKMAGKPVEDLKAVAKTPLVGETNVEVIKRMHNLSIVSAAEVVDLIPVIGTIFGAGSSYFVTYRLLSDALDELTENAQRVVKAAFGTD
ncbi:interferon-inducible GTPase 5-like [Scyliorhinus canicula]|uniref:interferon-inducible GTPase 5-like n=1 Tax=Scyliorhinus canicula TaxID=7830 RepID=UPI0018F737A2|nr:interferon-inducible GTPase 5-like [Scyliorhinus canicula]